MAALPYQVNRMTLPMVDPSALHSPEGSCSETVDFRTRHVQVGKGLPPDMRYLGLGLWLAAGWRIQRFPGGAASLYRIVPGRGAVQYRPITEGQ